MQGQIFQGGLFTMAASLCCDHFLQHLHFCQTPKHRKVLSMLQW
jgi:hypothetical protein